MIVAADEFIPGNGIPVDSVVIDRKINPLQIKQDGGKALKLLVLWRSDEDAQQRLDMVKEFNELCHSHGLVSIIEPVVRPPRRGDKFDREQASSMPPKSWATVALTSTKLKCRFMAKVRNKSFSVLHNV